MSTYGTHEIMKDSHKTKKSDLFVTHHLYYADLKEYKQQSFSSFCCKYMLTCWLDFFSFVFHFCTSLDFFFLVLCFVASNKKKVNENTQNLHQPPTFITNHHKQPPTLKNEEEDTTLSTIHRKILLELKKI